MPESYLKPEDQMMQWITSKWISRPIQVAAELGIADLLIHGPLQVEELARQTKTHAPTLYRLLRALSAVGIFAETENEKFQLTPLARCLCADAMLPLALMFLSDWHDKVWRNLEYSVKTGNSAFQSVFGEEAFDWLGKNTAARDLLDAGQALKANGFAKQVLEVFDFSDVATIGDIGGGRGAFLIQLMEAYPHIEGVVTDLPEAMNAAENAIAVAGLQDRCKAVACDFINAVPPVCDAYFLVNILHDWEDEICLKILSNVSRVMTAASKLWLVEYLIEPGPEFSVAKLLDIEVLVMGGGRERTADEYRKLAGSAGLSISKVIPTKGGPAILECIPT